MSRPFFRFVQVPETHQHQHWVSTNSGGPVREKDGEGCSIQAWWRRPAYEVVLFDQFSHFLNCLSFFLFCLNFECLSLRVAAPTPGTLLAFFGGNLIPVDSLEKAFEEEIGVPVTSLQPSDSRLDTSTKTEIHRSGNFTLAFYLQV